MKHVDDIDQLTTAELEEREKKIAELVAEIRALLPGLVSLTTDDRIHSTGKLRTGEDVALTAIVETIAADESPYKALADKDAGHDPNVFETKLLGARLGHLKVMHSIATLVGKLSDDVSDTALHIGEQVRPPLLLAYSIARPLAQASDRIKTLLQPALDFYAAIARQSAETRRKSKEAKAAKS